MQVITTITSKGQVTIPVKMRKKIGIKTPDKIQVILDRDEVRLRPFPKTLDEIYGAVKPSLRPENFKKIREKVRQYRAKRQMRILSDNLS